ncbi:hypothetical protein [Treponema sp.]|uniref:hypothetical protein n=1 Tax=Treponema sp. TaxID=166 RepID=UPI003FD8F678
MVNWTTIDGLREIFINKYEDSKLGSELEKACSEEYELMRDYNGRQILELLQNVDDAYGEKKTTASKEVAVKISFKNNILEVGNTGTAFSAETIERLCLGRASDKSSKNIGNKGTGFRSLLNDAEWIEIYSGPFSIRFSQKYAEEIFQQSLKKSALIQEQKANWKKDYPFCFPIMNCPEQIPPFESIFDTLIRVKVKENNNSKDTSIEKQLNQPFYKSLLFLPNITKILIETNEKVSQFEKLVDGDEVLIEGTQTDSSEEYYVYEKNAAIGNKNANLIIAVPKAADYDFSNEKLYCYFPIRNFQTPIHALIHAPFVTNNSRDDIPNDNEQINKQIFREIILFIKEISEKLSAESTTTLAIQTVTTFEDNKLWKTDFFNLEEEYIKIISEAKILPTVNGEFISLIDKPIIYENDYPPEFVGSEFKNLLERLDPRIITFIKKVCSYIKYIDFSYKPDEMIRKIGIIGSEWNIETQIRIFIWWSKYYKNCPGIPCLLKDSANDWITKKSDVYLPTDDGISVLPDSLSWVKLSILHRVYVNELIKQLKENYFDEWQILKQKYTAANTGDKRILAAFSRQHFAIDFTEQSSADLIIRQINSQIDNFEKSKTFINWFFSKYNDSLKEDSELSKLPFNLPNKNHEIKSIRELYLGADYGNSISEKLFSNTKYTSLVSTNELFEGTEKLSFISFLKKCGILTYPQVFDDSTLINDRKFCSYVHQAFLPSMNINYLTSKNIQNFNILIKTLSTQEIKEWLNNDEKIRALLFSQECDSHAKQQSNWNPSYFPSSAYIKYILNNTPWIELEGKKYAPNKIIKYGKLKNKIPGFYGISEQELIKYLGTDITSNFNLDFKESFGSLEETEIKTVINQLPSFDKGEISRKLYLDIIKYKKDLSPSSNYSNTGYNLLAMDGLFHLNNELQYADRKIPYLNENRKRFIAIQTKQSIETIRKWLGVERYKSNLKLKSYLSLNETKTFDSEINDIKISILSIIDQNKNNIDKVKRLKIIPCSKIEAIDIEQENREIQLEDYFFVENENTFYLKVPSDISINQIRIDDRFSSAMLDIFKQTLTLDLDQNLVALLVSKNSSSKKQKIDEDYGIDQWSNSYELLFNCNFLNQQVLKFFKNKNLDEELLAQISNIDFSTSLTEKEFPILISSLQKISSDINDLNGTVEALNFNIIDYWKNQYEKLKNSKFDLYKECLFNSLKDKDSAKKSEFLNKLNYYRNQSIKKSSFENSIYFNLDKKLQSDFPEISLKPIDFNIDENYTQNVESLITEFNLTHEDFDCIIQNYGDLKSRLYFEVPSELKEILAKEINQICITELKSAPVPKETKTIKTKLIDSPAQKSQPESKDKVEKSTKDYEHHNRQNEQAGKTAEEIAYNELRKTYPKLIWHSKNSKILADRNNPPSNVVCDMWNRGDENSYFEVKSAVDTFQMSINEYNSMKENQDTYEVVLVNRDNGSISRHKYKELDKFKKINEYLFEFKQIEEK